MDVADGDEAVRQDGALAEGDGAVRLEHEYEET